MRRITSCFLLLCVVVLCVNKGFSATKTVKSFMIYSPGKKKCVKAVAPRRVKLESCRYDDAFRWRWTTDGQVQNVKQGLCIEINDYAVYRFKRTELHLALCNYRKKHQKWRCEHSFYKDKKSYYITPANERLYGRWKASKYDDKVTVTRHRQDESLFLFTDKAGANMCDFDHRDHCLQTVAKIPTTSEHTCLVAVAKNSMSGYAEIELAGKTPLKGFSFYMWVKTRMFNYNANISLFSYAFKNESILSLAHRGYGKDSIHDKSRIDLFDRTIYVNTANKHALFGQSYWIHIALTRSMKKGTLSYYVNDVLVHEEHAISKRALSGNGILRLGYSLLEKEKWFNGLISQFDIYDRAPFSRQEIEERIRRQHCCHDNRLPRRNWLSWNQIMRSWTLHGTARIDKGVECTSFEIMPNDWINMEYGYQNCDSSFFVSDPRYVPEYQFTSSSWTPANIPSNGRASKKIPNAWCPESKDKRSYLQVDLGYVHKVTAIGTMVKLRKRHAKRMKVYYSENGIHWHSDDQVYEANQRLVPEISIVPLKSPVMARYLRLYPTGCVSSGCCLAIEVFGCDPVIDKKISEPEDGCTREDKPYILMYLPTAQYITRIQLKARKNKKPIRSFYMYYMSWKQWIPYQVDGKMKIFNGNSDTSRSFTHILTVPIFTHLVKIFPTYYRSSVCADFTFIGCFPSRDDFCHVSEVRGSIGDCRKLPLPQCSLGFVGNGHVCQDLNECDIKTGAYCDRNTLCRNKHGSFSCDPCKNSFIGDGRICQTSCEAFGITCGMNSYCDLYECKCYEEFIHNGTHCIEDPDFGKEPLTTTMRPDNIDGLCPEGNFNCYGDVIGTLEKLRKATLAFENFDYDDCSG